MEKDELKIESKFIYSHDLWRYSKITHQNLKNLILKAISANRNNKNYFVLEQYLPARQIKESTTFKIYYEGIKILFSRYEFKIDEKNKNIILEKFFINNNEIKHDELTRQAYTYSNFDEFFEKIKSLEQKYETIYKYINILWIEIFGKNNDNNKFNAINIDITVLYNKNTILEEKIVNIGLEIEKINDVLFSSDDCPGLNLRQEILTKKMFITEWIHTVNRDLYGNDPNEMLNNVQAGKRQELKYNIPIWKDDTKKSIYETASDLGVGEKKLFKYLRKSGAFSDDRSSYNYSHPFDEYKEYFDIEILHRGYQQQNSILVTSKGYEWLKDKVAEINETKIKNC